MNKAAVGVVVLQRAVHESTKASAQLERREVSANFRRSAEVQRYLELRKRAR